VVTGAMRDGERGVFESDIWRPALEKYAGVTHLTVALYDAIGRLVCGPINSTTSLFALFAQYQYDSGLFTKCAQRCLHRTEERSAIVVTNQAGLGVVGTSLVLNGGIVGAAVAGYHLVDFPQSVAMNRLAREAQLPFPRLWEIVRRQTPASKPRIIVQGELLQVLGDALLRETDRTRQYEETAAELRATSAAKDEFLAVLSHELRTPLTPILGWARMLKMGNDPARVERAADVIERNALLQTKLVEDLLELTRLARGKVAFDLTTLDLGHVIRSAVDAYCDLATQKHVALQVIGKIQPVLMEADANRLQQVFGNILSNALKFTPDGGRVTVTLTREDEKGIVRIRDTGEGIAPEFLPFVFDIFRQQEHGTRRNHDGLGIGLALVKRLTELQGGRVALASAGQGRGTEVTVEFPVVADADQASPAGPPVLKSPRALHGLRCLVVEDMDDTREATQLILQGLGADVLVAKDGREALELVDAVDPDVVLCDLRMPRMDGFEFIRALHGRPGATCPPVIAISGFASRVDHLRTQSAGFEGHLDKPFDDAGLLAAVGAVIGRRGIT